MIWPEASALLPWCLLLLRIVLAAVFLPSGWSHLTQPKKRAKSIEMPVWFTFVLGLGEAVAALALALGVVAQLAALILILVMLGAIGMKIVRWKKGFFDESGFGWHYDLLLAAACFVILCLGGGAFALMPN